MFKKILAYSLTVCLLLSLTVPAFAVDEVYTVTDDTTAISPVIYYTDGYTPGMYAGVDRSVSFLASSGASYGSYSSYGYVPTGFDDPSSGGVRQWTFADYTPVVTDGVSSISATTTIPATYFLSGSMLTVNIPSTQDAYFDFQSSNILFDQSSPSADTFYLNGTLTFKLFNLWSFVSGSSDYDDVSFYRASDPLAVQLLINGKPYGDIVDVTSYTSPFTGVNVGTPANASVTFDNLKVYYQGDTPELIGFRVYTGSAYGQSSHTYGDYQTLTLQNLISFRWSEQPDIIFIQESADSDYTGDLSGIQSILNTISGTLSSVFSSLRLGSGFDFMNLSGDYVTSSTPLTLIDVTRQGFLGLRTWLFNSLRLGSGYSYLDLNGNYVTANGSLYLTDVLRQGFLGLRKWYDISFRADSGDLYLDSNGNYSTSDGSLYLTDVLRQGFLGLRTWLFNSLRLGSGYAYLDLNGNYATVDGSLYLTDVLRQGFLGLRKWYENSFRVGSGYYYLDLNGNVQTVEDSIYLTQLLRNGILGLRRVILDGQEYVADTVFPWQSYNMETHQLNAATNITGQNNLFFTAFQSIEDKLGRLAYVFGSDEDLALKDAADPGTDAFRENFGGGASLSDIGDAAEVSVSVPQIMDAGFNFADGIEEIGSNDGYLAWFTSETWAALDSTGAAVAADPDYLSDYYDNLRKVEEKRHWGD